jgi:hypothetical protein
MAHSPRISHSQALLSRRPITEFQAGWKITMHMPSLYGVVGLTALGIVYGSGPLGTPEGFGQLLPVAVSTGGATSAPTYATDTLASPKADTTQSLPPRFSRRGDQRFCFMTCLISVR